MSRHTRLSLSASLEPRQGRGGLFRNSKVFFRFGMHVGADERVSSRAAAPRRLGPPCWLSSPTPFSAWNLIFLSVLAVTTTTTPPPFSAFYFLPSQRVVLCHDNIWRHAHVLWTSTSKTKQQWELSCKEKRQQQEVWHWKHSPPWKSWKNKKDQNAALLLLWKTMAKAPSARPKLQSKGIGDDEKNLPNMICHLTGYLVNISFSQGGKRT